MTKRKMPARMICFIVAATVLTGTLAVSAFNGSPYETLKNAIFDTLMLDNFTFEGGIALTVDGEIYADEPLSAIWGNGRELSYYESHFTFNTNFPDPNRRMSVSTVGHVDDTPWYYVRTWSYSSSIGSPSGNGNPILSPAERHSTEFRLAELAIDLVVGDLKNNFTLTDQGNGIRRIQGAVTGHQLPEIVRMFIDLRMEEDFNSRLWMWPDGDFGQREDFYSVLDIPFRSLNIDLLQGVADIDSDGLLTYVNVSAIASITNVFDDTHVLEVNFSIRLSDIGTSNPQIPIPGADELFTEEFLHELSVRNLFDDESHIQELLLGERRFATNFYFTVGDDGYIDPDSFTSTRPTGLPGRW